MDWLDFSYIERHIIFNAKVNQTISVNFLLDTGAGQSAIFETVAKKIGLAEQDRGEEVRTIAGSEGQRGTTLFSSLTTGAIEHNEVTYLVLPDHMRIDTSFNVVAGFNILSKAKILIDFFRKRLVFLEKDKTVPITGMKFVQFDIRENVPIIRARIDGELVDALLDTGSGESVVFEKAAHQRNKRRTCRISLGTDFGLEIELAIQGTSELSRGLKIGAILGNNMWDECIVLIDYTRRLLGIKPRHENPGRAC